jgi:hypothetical protein
MTPIVSTFCPCAQSQNHGVGQVIVPSNLIAAHSFYLNEVYIPAQPRRRTWPRLAEYLWLGGGCGKKQYQLLNFSQIKIFPLFAKSKKNKLIVFGRFRGGIFFGVQQIILWVFLLRL